MLDTTIVDVATPSILSSLHASLDQVLWVFIVPIYALLHLISVRFLVASGNAAEVSRRVKLEPR
jgi:hypothetical protein